jgi:hypothetical protein
MAKVKWEDIIVNGTVIGKKVKKEEWLRFLEEDDTEDDKIEKNEKENEKKQDDKNYLENEKK